MQPEGSEGVYGFQSSDSFRKLLAWRLEQPGDVRPVTQFAAQKIFLDQYVNESGLENETCEEKNKSVQRLWREYPAFNCHFLQPSSQNDILEDRLKDQAAAMPSSLILCIQAEEKICGRDCGRGGLRLASGAAFVLYHSHS